MVNSQLCHLWHIPEYAQSYIHVAVPEQDQPIPISGYSGDFQTKTSPEQITILWGDAPLVQLSPHDTTFDWQGEVHLGGFVTAIHVSHVTALEMDLAIMTVEAQPLRPHVVPYPSANDRHKLPYAPADFLAGVADDTAEGVTTWLADIDSPLVSLLQDAMNQGYRVYLFGQLAEETLGWHRLFALPILLEAVTTFMR